MKKNIFLYVVIFLQAFILNSCMKDNVMETVAKEVNKKCPIALNSANEITAVEYENKILTYRIKMDEEFSKITALSRRSSTLRVNTLRLITGSEGNLRKLYELAADEGVCIRYIYKGNNSGLETSIILFPSQIERALNEKEDKGISRLEAEINFANISMPIDEGNGIIFRKIEFQNNVVYYLCDVDEKQISIDNLKKNESELRRSLKQDLKGLSEEDKQFLEMIKEEGCSLAYKYKGTTTGKEVIVMFSNDEVMEFAR